METTYSVIVQARCSSNRLPGKVLADICGKPMLLRQVQRLSYYLNFLPVIVATSTDSTDDPIEELCIKENVSCFRGDLHNVMERFIHCADQMNIDYIIRVGGDDPLIDPMCCEHLYQYHLKYGGDFLYASHKDGWPYGAAAELIKVDALKKIYAKTQQKLYLEHTIPYFFDHPDEFIISKIMVEAKLHRPNFYFSVDYREDLELVRKIFHYFVEKKNNEYFKFNELIDYLDENPDLFLINKGLHCGFER